ncbi:chaperone modulator CbpM [Dankookia sp. GCM10030260]|uniref:chaperone modulator CbpM n=1 Tax=Dankookia sp. GCM10030260 TaxID=3273390 RepID=UPI003606E372
MITITALSQSLGLEEAEIHRWVTLHWLRPDPDPEGWLFQPVDLARGRLIVELRSLALDEEAMPVVLSLLDQLHATRRDLRLLRQAVEDAAPDAVRARLRDLLNEG